MSRAKGQTKWSQEIALDTASCYHAKEQRWAADSKQEEKNKTNHRRKKFRKNICFCE